MNARPIITIIFDDGSDTVYNEAFPVMQSLGLVGDVAVVSLFIGNAGNMTAPQLQELYDAGWGMVNHTKLHTNLTTYNDSQVIASVSVGKAEIVAYGWTRGTECLVPPINGVDDRVRSLVSPYASLVTSSVQSLNTFPLDKYRINRSGVSNSSVATVKGWIDDAITNSKYLHLNFHKIAPESTTLDYDPGKFAEVMEYVANKVGAGEIELLTLDQLRVELNTSYMSVKGGINGV
jgi:hypothetical protein